MLSILKLLEFHPFTNIYNSNYMLHQGSKLSDMKRQNTVSLTPSTFALTTNNSNILVSDVMSN